MVTVIPSEEEIADQLNEASCMAAEGADPWPGMTYIQGIEAALAWVVGQVDEPPLEDG